MQTISKYDDKGPAWYWNTIHLGEHTGTHFDAPIHWITGKDYATTHWIPFQHANWSGQPVVIDVSKEVADTRLPADTAACIGMGRRHGKIQPGSWGAAAE